tara:strand:- start:124 stop:1095 length:972 start_codon:yes stop_codon:yes gene_type:complete
MCGLIGFTGNKEANPNIIKQLMIANDSRGGHSTGYFDGSEFVKCLGKSVSIHQEVRQLKTNKFIGHTRFSTHGATTLPNQHPFEYGNVIGAHNGVVHNYREVGKKYNLKETEVDSQMIFNVLNKTDNDFNTLGKFTGALATLFTIGDKFYTYRKTNPLWVGRDKNGDVYFSSLKDVLVGCKLHNIYQLKEGRLYVWIGNTVVAKIDIEHDPIASKYGAVKKQWWEYGNTHKPKSQFYTQQRGVNSGITDMYDNVQTCGWDEIEDVSDVIGMEDVDITYDIDEVNEADIYKAICGANPKPQPKKKEWKVTDGRWSRSQQTKMFD